MIGFLRNIVVLFTLVVLINVNAQDKITINHADSLVGKTIDGEQVREATGNVSLTHNNLNILVTG